MKKIAIGITLLALSGCANLKVQWVANLSYQSDNVAADIAPAREEKPAPAISYRIGK